LIAEDAKPPVDITGEELRARRITLIWLFSGGFVLFALAALGGVMRLAQALGGALDPQLFYEILTIHGTGMVTIPVAIEAVILWYLLKPVMPLSTALLRLEYFLVAVGVLLILIGVVGGNYAGAWTFLYPLPANRNGAGGAWNTLGASAFLVGLALVVVAILLWCLDFLRAGIVKYGGLGSALGFDYIRGDVDPAVEHPDPSVLAGTVVAILGVTACLAGALIVGLSLANIAFPSLRLDPLFAKNVTYYAGHTIANIQIYLAAGIAYSILPVYARRPWHINRIIALAWLATLAIVMLAFFHHLYEDFVQPLPVQYIGEVASYAAAIPPLVVTIFGGVLIVYRSGIRWSAAPLFTFAGLAGWAIGGLGAVIDSTPVVNQYFHNTLWVPAHFHTYMALGVVFFIIGAVYHLMPRITGIAMSERTGRVAAILLIAGGWTVVLCWFASGALGNPRRYVTALPGLEWLAWIGFLGAVVALIGALLVLRDFVGIALELMDPIPRRAKKLA
jgi:cytochrome c oxidase subunit 1